MTGCEDLLEDLGIVGSVFSDREENASRAFVGQRLEDGGRVLRPRAVVKGQHDFLVAQEIKLFEMFETKSGSTGGVDLDDTADPERVGIGAGAAWPPQAWRPERRRQAWRRSWQVEFATRPHRSRKVKSRLQRSILSQLAWWLSLFSDRAETPVFYGYVAQFPAPYPS